MGQQSEQEASRPQPAGDGAVRPRFNRMLAHTADAATSLFSIVRLVLIGGIVIYALNQLLSHQGTLFTWLRDAQKLSGFGVSVERSQLTALPIARAAGGNNRYFLNPEQLESVQARAIWLQPILSGALVLWVDDNPVGNNNLLQFFQWAGISIRLARTNDEAMREIEWAENATRPFDLVISDVGRSTSGETRREQPLARCPVHLFALPPGEEATMSLAAFNVDVSRSPDPGLLLAERMHEKHEHRSSRDPGARVTPLIFFTEWGRVMASRCAELSTDNAFRLIHGVFGVLERQRAAEFNRFRPPWAGQQPAQR